MRVQFLLIIYIFCSGCQYGLIPCPNYDKPSYKKVNFRATKNHSNKTDNSVKEKQYHNYYVFLELKKKHTKKIVSVEEWDCPRPGTQKISKNTKRKSTENKIKLDTKRNKKLFQSDSTSSIFTGKY